MCDFEKAPSLDKDISPVTPQNKLADKPRKLAKSGYRLLTSMDLDRLSKELDIIGRADSKRMMQYGTRRKCPMCGKTFLSSGKKYCSPECSYKGYLYRTSISTKKRRAQKRASMIDQRGE